MHFFAMHNSNYKKQLLLLQLLYSTPKDSVRASAPTSPIKKESQATLNSLYKLKTVWKGDDAPFLRDLLTQTVTLNDSIKNCLDSFVDSSNQTVNDFKGISEFISIQMLGEALRHTIVSSLKTVHIELYNELMEQAIQAQIEAKQIAQEARKKKVQTQDGNYTSNIFGDPKGQNIVKIRGNLNKLRTQLQRTIKADISENLKSEIVQLLNYISTLYLYSDNELTKFNFSDLQHKINYIFEKIDMEVKTNMARDSQELLFDDDDLSVDELNISAKNNLTIELQKRADYNLLFTPLKEIKQQLGQAFRINTDLDGLILLRDKCVMEIKVLIKESVKFIKAIRASISKGDSKERWKEIIAAYDIFAGKYNLIIPVINSFYDTLRLKVKQDKMNKSKKDNAKSNADYYLPDFSSYTFDDLPTTSSSYSRFKRMRYIGAAEQLSTL